ncbi:MAG: hypothetical protein U7127_29620 [Phormidium sp.]
MILAIGNRAGHFGGEREQGTGNREQGTNLSRLRLVAMILLLRRLPAFLLLYLLLSFMGNILGKTGIFRLFQDIE